MIVVMKPGSSKKEVNCVIRQIERLGFKAHPIFGVTRTVIGAIGDDRDKHLLQSLAGLSSVEQLVPILQPFKLASREFKPQASIIRVKKAVFGGPYFGLIAGPCTVESERQLMETAVNVARAGAKMLRGGAFKPRTSPYSFQGLEEKGLKFLAKAREKTGLPFVTEVLNPEDVPLVGSYADVLQIGARNAKNFSLLRRVGKLGKPVLLKRGPAMTLQEFVMSAEYLPAEGGHKVILCERGMRTFETAT
ncbi:MAG: 3-deoxy-7-phosphoheptulonate synthase, partial [Candidatus Omnitrophica bacterium]|nr:3-deoxy-7-phosphoheptulonate synthase [Candidatus Omnitrophota bacterium]